jgi:predicted SnoaL-like aldol condensation-catalyzing enzyme
MRTTIRALLLTLIATVSTIAMAQEPVKPADDQEKLLGSPVAKLAANKRFVYDFWREVFEGGHMDRVDHYLAEGYIQHNPNVPTGRDGFVSVFSKIAKPVEIEPKIKAPLVAVVADGDFVVLAFGRSYPDPKDASKTYTTTWFDMFRIENGLIVEHWDPAQKR